MILMGFVGLGIVITLPYVIKAFFAILLWMMVQPLQALMCSVFGMCVLGGYEILLKKVPK